jgi:hypothetical protein
MTQINPTTFSQKWDKMLSPGTEESYRSSAFSNHVFMIATAISSIASTIFASLMLPEATTFLLMGIVFLISPAVELSKKFLLKAQEAKKLEEQAQKVRNYYLSFVAKKESNPEAKALALHWKQKANAAEIGYQTLRQKALEKGKEPGISFTALQRARFDTMEAEKTAGKIKVYALFLESLVYRPILFQKTFNRYGENLSSALSSFSTWDQRDVERRSSDLNFAMSDSLLNFHNTNIPSISYSEVFQTRWKEQIKKRLNTALIQKMAH